MNGRLKSKLHKSTHAVALEEEVDWTSRICCGTEKIGVGGRRRRRSWSNSPKTEKIGGAGQLTDEAPSCDPDLEFVGEFCKNGVRGGDQDFVEFLSSWSYAKMEFCKNGVRGVHGGDLDFMRKFSKNGVVQKKKKKVKLQLNP